MLNIYNPAAHFICYPVTPTMTSWAFTQRTRVEIKETWKSCFEDEKIDLQKQLLRSSKIGVNPLPRLSEDLID
jgi:hypothetical protein